MASIKVNSKVMKQKADTLKKAAKSIEKFMEEMKSDIAKLKSTWQGTAATDTIATFNKISETFPERYQTIEQYATFLNGAAEEFDKVEQLTSQQAQQGGKAK